MNQCSVQGPELGESWKERVAKFNELENARLDELENARLDELENARLDETLNERMDKLEEEWEERDLKRWLEWYKKVGIHREFARGYARHAARMSC